MVYTIRNVKEEDLDQVTEVEALCFPAAEAAMQMPAHPVTPRMQV